jgi:hypothetical protein
MAVVLVSLRETNVGGDEKRESTVLDASVAEHAHAATAVSALSRTHAHTLQQKWCKCWLLHWQGEQGRCGRGLYREEASVGNSAWRLTLLR